MSCPYFDSFYVFIGFFVFEINSELFYNLIETIICVTWCNVKHCKNSSYIMYSIFF